MMKKFLEKLLIPLVLGLLLFACSPTSSSSVSNSPSGGNVPDNSQVPVNIDGQSSVSGGGETNLQLTSLPNIPPADTIETPSTPDVPAADVLGQVDYSPAGASLLTFVDENKLMTFKYPQDWTHEHGVSSNYYYDTFLSPAGDAKMENLVYNDGVSFTASRKEQIALRLLYTHYSPTGKEGDIEIIDDSILPDGSEQLSWRAIGDEYSGVSFLELYEDDKSTFLMFTALWNRDSDSFTLGVIESAITSYLNR